MSEAIYAAVAALMDDVTWDRGDGKPQKFKVTTRRIVLFNEAKIQPWCGQAEYGENEEQITGFPYKTTLECHWLIYHQVGSNKKAEPTIENNLIVDAVREAVKPKPADRGYFENRNTLGGLCHHFFIQGRIFKDPGDLDDQALILVPFKILVP